MSKYKRFDIVFNNEQAFRQALEDVCRDRGARFEEAPGNDINLVGYMGKTREERCKYVVRRSYLNTASNDLGFEVQTDGTIVPVISEFDSGKYATAAQDIVKSVKARYAYHEAMNLATMNGYTVTEVQLPDGTIELSLDRYY